MNISVLKLEKKCSSCGILKPVDSFWRDSRRSALSTQKSRYGNCIECSELRFRKIFDVFSDSSEEMKALRSCRICNLEKPLHAFRKTRHYSMGRTTDCKECYNDYRYSKAETKIKSREYGRKYRHSLSAVEFKQMFDAQNGKCGVCESDMDFLAKSTCVDHDHETGIIREVLCQKCNLGLGHFSDNIENMKRAIAYLEKHKEEKGE